ncbi:MAG TPA: glycosyltransferase [Acidimicrobiales bacterium]|jgi:UDP-N-acetylglucosamine:LPS N-acetylglucosamine transferase|nr:glycosyltransferase [Acidimicrobiales bacterium]
MPRRRATGRVLLVSARMGAGHQGAAVELARRLQARGRQPVVVDFLDAFPRALAEAWERFYRFQLRYAPDSYESSYQLFYRHPALWGPFVRFERALAGRRVLAWVRDHDPDVIVSTYSFATLVLGKLRQEGAVTVPVVNFLTDFGVHPRAVHPAVDLNLALHAGPAGVAARLTSRPTAAAGPAVAPAYADAAGATERRAEGRAWLGVGDEEQLVLVAAGSWGVGDHMVETVATIVDSGRFRVATVCGSDRRLRRRLEQRNLDIVLGWTDRMPVLMAAADVVVENAGGLTSLEAFASGVPVVTYRPIPGHGRDNVKGMLAAGVTTSPVDDAGLLVALDALTSPGPTREAQLAAARGLFGDDPAEHILALAPGLAPCA